MRSWSLHIGRLFGSEVRIHVSFLFLFGFIWMAESSRLGAQAAGRSLALTAIVMASVLLHELGHALVALLQKGSTPGQNLATTRIVILMPIGDVTLSDAASRSRQDVDREARNALIAPVLNLFAAFVAGAIVLGMMPAMDLRAAPLVTASNLPRSLVWINLFLGFLNLLPGYPLDAGRILRAILARRMEMVPATRRAVGIGQGFALLFILAGIWNIWWMLIGFFLFLAAQLEERSVVFQSVLQQVTLEEVMLTDFATLSPADTLDDALEKAVHTLQDDFPVVRGGDMVGVISKRNIVQALREEGNGYVQSAMNRAFNVGSRKDTLASAFAKLTAPGMSMLPVVHEDRLVGIITLQNLMHSMSLLAERNAPEWGSSTSNL